MIYNSSFSSLIYATLLQFIRKSRTDVLKSVWSIRFPNIPVSIKRLNPFLQANRTASSVSEKSFSLGNFFIAIFSFLSFLNKVEFSESKSPIAMSIFIPYFRSVPAPPSTPMIKSALSASFLINFSEFSSPFATISTVFICKSPDEL